MKCPCCRQELPGVPDLVISLETNTACARGRFVGLQPDQAVILFALRQAWPGVLVYDDVKDALWGTNRRNAPVDPDGIMRTQIHRLRKLILPLQYSIVCVLKTGFHLVDQRPPWAVNINSTLMIDRHKVSA